MHTKFWLIDVNQSWKSENTEIVAIIIWFLGTCALPFLFRWANTASTLHVTHVQHRYLKAKAQQSPAISRERQIRCAQLYG